MKKRVTKAIALLMCVMTAAAFMPAFAFAADTEETEETAIELQETADSIIVNVTISDKGMLVLKNKPVEVTDVNENGDFDIDDVLYCAHQQNYAGGTAEGYNSYTGVYGLSLGKLWGDESGSFGYRINNNEAWSLADSVVENDNIYAFVYSDGVSYKDKYAFFDKTEATVKTNAEFKLVLNVAGYDEEWNPVNVPYENAEIKVNGESKGKPDSSGEISLSFDKPGKYKVTASVLSESDDIIVSPVCTVTVISDNADDYQEVYTVEKEKEEAIAELTECYELANYRDIVKLEVSCKILSGVVAINAAVDSEGVEKALRSAKENLNKVKTDAQMTKEENIVKAVEINKITINAGKKKATVKWSGNNAFSGYQIYYKKAKKSAKYTYTTAVYKTIKNLKTNTKVTFKVRGYKKMNGKTIYGKWSKSKTVKIK